MHHNLDRQPSTQNSPKPLSIRLFDIEPDEHAAYVHSVCSSLLDSRFGPGRPRPLVIHLSEWPELQQALFYDMTVAGPVPAYTILPDSEVAQRYAADVIRRELTPVNPYNLTLHIRPGQPSNLGRGSP